MALELLAAISQQVARSGLAARVAATGSTAVMDDVFSSLNLASSLSSSTRSGLAVEAAVGDAEVGLAITLGAALPWICIHVQRSESAGKCVPFLCCWAN